jgi:hypothetical protein
MIAGDSDADTPPEQALLIRGRSTSPIQEGLEPDPEMYVREGGT